MHISSERFNGESKDPVPAQSLKKPLVSVVIPAFNNAALLRETLDGVKRQTMKNVEVIVVDDGSNDDTAEVVRCYDPEIVYRYQPNQGQAAARNNGVSLARGYYIAFCDHDDVWNERHLEKLLECMTSHPNTGMAFDNAEYFGNGVGLKLCVTPRLSKSLDTKIIGLNFLLWKYPVASMSVVMVRKDCFQRLQGLSSRSGAMDDYHFYLRMAANRDVRYVDYVGCRKRVSDSNLSSLVNLKYTNVLYLEDISKNHPEVVRKVGRISFRARLGRKYFKLGRYYSRHHDVRGAREMFWRAYRANPFNPRYLLKYVSIAFME
ncbi:MAG TPA: glycosyltransferase family 2 protein [Candidatus Binatia bacterium]